MHARTHTHTQAHTKTLQLVCRHVFQTPNIIWNACLFMLKSNNITVIADGENCLWDSLSSAVGLHADRPSHELQRFPKGPETGLGCFLFMHTWCIAICSWAAPGGHWPIREQLSAPHPLCDLAGGNGVFEVLSPCQGGTQQAQGLARPCRALQNSIHLLQKQGGHTSFHYSMGIEGNLKLIPFLFLRMRVCFLYQKHSKMT